MSTTRPPRDTSPPQPAEPSMREDLWRAAHHPGTAAGADVIEAPEALRPVVPSDRELELGLAADGHAGPAPAPAQPQREKLSLRQRGRRLVHDYRPSEVTAGTSAVPLVVISTITLLDSMDANGLGILLPYMRKDLGFDIRFLAAMGQILGIVSTILAPLIGYMADRVSRTKMGFIGVTGSGIASFVTGLGSTRLHLAATRTGSGIVSSLNNPIGLPLLADYYPPQTRGRVFSFYFTGGQLGTIIGPLVAGALATVFSWRAAFFFLGGLSALAGIGFLFLKEPVRGSMDRLSAGVSQEEAQKPPPPPPGLVESWRACASIVTLRRLWYAEPFLTVGGSGLAIVLIVYQVDVFRLPAGVVAVVTALGAVSGMIGLVVGGPMVDRFVAYRPGRVLTLLGALLVIDIFLFIGLAFSRIVWISLPIVLLLPGINSILIPARTAIETLVIPARIRGIGLQTKAPWRLLGSLMFLGLLFLVDSSSDPIALLVYLPLFLAGALLHIAAGAGVERDIRAARAADLAEQAGLQSQESGREALLICRDVDVHYEGVQILFGVDFDVAQCEIVALLGTNGAGKSTLLRAISGLTEASNGAIFLDGRDITHVPPYEIAARRVVQMPGGRGIFPTLSVAENLRAATWLSEDDEKFIESQMTRILEEFFPALKARLDEPAGALSGGEQQMLALGQAFLMRPRLLMIDELSLGLAPGVVRQLVSILKELRELGS
ncbi:MAG TPA: MFS transporter, partial [Actinomycetota bacterium]|nr:MFS transporter [Actinomycetota bacterium]